MARFPSTCPVFFLIALAAAGLEAHPVIAAPARGPAVTVFVRFSDAPAEQVDTSIAAPLANAITSLPQLDQIESESSDSLCTTVIRFAPGTDADAAIHRVADALRAVRPRLPAGIDPPQLRAGDARALPAFWVAVQSDTHDTAALSAIARTIVSPGLAQLPGVANVRIIGGADPRPTLWLDAARLAASGLTPGDVTHAITEQAGPQTKAEPRIRAPDELSQLVLRAGVNGAVVRARDVGRFEMAAAERAWADLDGHPAILLGITASQRGQRAQAADGERALAGSAKQLPAGVKVTLALTLSPQSLLVRIDGPAGASAEQLRPAIDRAETALRQKTMPAPSAVISFFEPGADGARILLQFPAATPASTTAAKVRSLLSTALPPEVLARVCPVSFDADGSPISFPICIALSGPDVAALRLWASATLARLPNSVTDAGTEPPNSGEPQLRFNVDRKRCEAFGLKEADVAEMIALVRGRPKRVPLSGAETLDIRLEGDQQHKPPPFHLPKMRNATGDWLSLANVTTVEQTLEPMKLLRVNHQPCILLTAAPSPDTPLDTAASQCLQAANDALRESKHLEGCRAIRLDR